MLNTICVEHSENLPYIRMLTARSLVAIIIRLGKTNHAGQNTIKTINFTILLTNNKTLIQFCSSLENGVYNLKDSSEIYKVYCQMTKIPGCGPGGWTLVMKINGDKVIFV